MTTILITDTHFGIRQNSMTWLNSQCSFLEKQLIPYIKTKVNVRLIHLGDVFDSRSTISTIVASRIVNIFEQIVDLVDEFIIISGNHDYYSPNTDEVNTLKLLIHHPKIKIISKTIYYDENGVYVPWYKWLDSPEEIQDIIDNNNIENVFTHADLINEPINVKCKYIYSGHIHTPYCKGRIRNLGSTYALTFNDANTPHGFYVLSGNKLEFIENTESIKFHKLYNHEIFGELCFGPNDYIELHINQSNMMVYEYADRITYITKRWKNVWIVPQTDITTGNLTEETFNGYDISEIARSLIPDDLKTKFNEIIKYINNRN